MSQYSFISDAETKASFWKGVTLGVLLGGASMFILLLSIGAYFNL